MNFDKYYDVYEKNSFAQKKVAENLFSFMKENEIFKEKIATIFEIVQEFLQDYIESLFQRVI